MENYASLILLFAMGYLLKHLPKFPRDTATSLNLFVIYVSLPAMILHQVPTLRFSSSMLLPALLPWAMLALSAGLVVLGARALGWPRDVTAALLLVVPLGNTSFLGLPMVSGFFGSDKVAYAILYDQFGTFPALSIYGTLVLAYYGGNETPTPAQIARKIITFPPFIALLLALATSGLRYPTAVASAFKLIAASLVPVVMVAIGFQYKLAIDKQHLPPLAVGLSIKLVIAPLAALGLCLALGLNGMVAKVSVFEAAMPPMVTAGALAIMAGLAPELTAAMVGVGILLSFATLPLLHKLLVTLL